MSSRTHLVLELIGLVYKAVTAPFLSIAIDRIGQHECAACKKAMDKKGAVTGAGPGAALKLYLNNI